jgi:membrane-associated protease RseP (regulator of RpoE activity)
MSKLFVTPLVFNFFRALGYLLTGFFGLSFLALVLLFVHGIEIILNFFKGVRSIPGIAPLIPGIEIKNVPITVPWHGWIILVIILVIHEMSHGVQAFREKFRLKSLGVLFLGLLPIGAFVEPDEKELKKSKNDEKALRVLGAGPISNILLAILASLLLFFVLKPLLLPSMIAEEDSLGVGVVVAGTYAEPGISQLPKGTQILGMDNGFRKVENSIDFSSRVKYALDRMGYVQLRYKLPSGEILDKNIAFNEQGKLGVFAEDRLLGEPSAGYKWKAFFISSPTKTKYSQGFVIWLILLNIIVALTNFLPVIPFDGGRMANIILSEYLIKEKEEKKLQRKRNALAGMFIILGIILLVINILPLFF